MNKGMLIGLMAAALCAQPAMAGVITWTDWTSATVGAAGSASGTMGSIGISYSGDVAFAQLGSGIDYWTEGSPAPYTASSVIDNAPTAAEMIAMSLGGTTQTVTFSTAVVDPIMAIVSQGRPTLPVTYDFDAPFTLLSEGRGYWGDGTYVLGAGDTLTGYELHGAIQFIGTFTSLSWVTNNAEYWHGFTFGLPVQPAVEHGVPEPTGIALFSMALLGLCGRLLRRR